MKKTCFIALLVAFGSLLLVGDVAAEKRTDKASAGKVVEKTVPKRSAVQSKNNPSSTSKKPDKSTSVTTGVNQKKKPAKQFDIVQEFSNPEVGLSGSQTGEQINWQAITSGGGFSSSLNFGLLSAIGQTASGQSSSTNFSLNSGFVQSFSGSCCANAGDANNDTKTNIADVTFLIARIFAGGTAPVCCEQADVNADNKVNIADVTFLIARIFAGGAAPVCGPTGITC